MKRIVIPVTFEYIKQEFLEADDNVTLFAVEVNQERQIVNFHIMHDSYDEVPIGAVAPSAAYALKWREKESK